MKTKNKIVAGLTALGLAAGSTVVGLDQACVFDAEVLTVRNEKVCFSTDSEYKKYKDARINAYKNGGANRAELLLTDEGKEMVDVVNHELQKNGPLTFDYDEEEDVILQIINNL